MTHAKVAGRLVDDFRKRAAVTKTALAAVAGVPLSYLVKVIDGRATLTMDKLDRAIGLLRLSDAEAEKLRHANLRARANREGLELERLAAMASKPGGSCVPEGALPVRYVPILSRVPAGSPADYGDGDYPPGFAEEYLAVPEPLLRRDPSLFALRIDGESMLPRFKHGDLVLVGPLSPVRDGKPAVVKIDGAVTCKLWRRRGDDVSLTPLNPDYAVHKCRASEVEWAYPVVLVMSTV